MTLHSWIELFKSRAEVVTEWGEKKKSLSLTPGERIFEGILITHGFHTVVYFI